MSNSQEEIDEKQLINDTVEKMNLLNKHKFWQTQPVCQTLGDQLKIDETGPIDSSEIMQKSDGPYPLPSQFEWCELNVIDPKSKQTSKDLKELYEMLTMNYVEDGDAMFRFEYSEHFIKWALCPPEYKPEWHLGVRVKASSKLVGFISAIPAKMDIVDNKVNLVEINFLCVHKKLRSKRLAPMLIKEITRRVNEKGIWQAVYTAGVLIPTPVTAAKYFHRSLNPKKLIEVGFSALHPRMTMARTIKLYKTDEVDNLIWNELKMEDGPDVFNFVNKYYSEKKYKVSPSYSNIAEVMHWLFPIKNVVYTFISRDVNTSEIIGLYSFYSLPSQCLKHEKHSHVYAAYSFLQIGSKNLDLENVMRQSIARAKEEGFDVFNCLNLGENATFLDRLKFGIGDGTLHYYFYNYAIAGEVKPSDMALVLL